MVRGDGTGALDGLSMVYSFYDPEFPERWPTIGKPMNEPQWGTLGKCGWTGVTNTKPLGC